MAKPRSIISAQVCEDHIKVILDTFDNHEPLNLYLELHPFASTMQMGDTISWKRGFAYWTSHDLPNLRDVKLKRLSALQVIHIENSHIPYTPSPSQADWPELRVPETLAKEILPDPNRTLEKQTFHFYHFKCTVMLDLFPEVTNTEPRNIPLKQRILHVHGGFELNCMVNNPETYDSASNIIYDNAREVVVGFYGYSAELARAATIVIDSINHLGSRLEIANTTAESGELK